MSYWDKYRNQHEPKEHWEMRKRFFEAHKDTFDEDRLLCLAQTFYNVEFLGCKYPELVMKQIEELSKGIADDHRDAKKTKIQRTFVQASEAAESKVCRREIKRKHEENAGEDSGMSSGIQGQTIHQVLQNQNRPAPKNTASGLDFRLVEKYLDRNPPLSQLILLRMKNESSLTFDYLQRSTRISHVKALFHYRRLDKQIEARLSIAQKNQQMPNEVAVATMAAAGSGSFISKTNKQILKTKMLESADQALHAGQFCVVINNRFYSSQDNVEREDDEEESKEEESKEEEIEEEKRAKEELVKIEEKKKEDNEKKKYISDEYEKLTENNIGSKLLRLMGWSGGGLGKTGQGIAEPVPITGRMDNKRPGLGKEEYAAIPKKIRGRREGPHKVLQGEDGEATMGLSVNRQDGLKGEQFKSWAHELLTEYLHSPNLLWFEDLIFAPTFTREERAVFHILIQKNKLYRDSLTCKSYGKDEARQMIIGRKAAQNGRMILRDLILCGDNPKFSLIVPEKFYAWCEENGYNAG